MPKKKLPRVSRIVWSKHKWRRERSLTEQLERLLAAGMKKGATVPAMVERLSVILEAFAIRPRSNDPRLEAAKKWLRRR